MDVVPLQPENLAPSPARHIGKTYYILQHVGQMGEDGFVGLRFKKDQADIVLRKARHLWHLFEKSSLLGKIECLTEDGEFAVDGREFPACFASGRHIFSNHGLVDRLDRNFGLKKTFEVFRTKAHSVI